MMSPFSWTVNAFGCTCRSIRACTTLYTHLHPPSTLLAGVVLPHQTSTCIAFVKAAPTQLSWLRAARRRGRSWRAAWRIQHILTAVNPFIPIKLFFLILLRECVPASFPETPFQWNLGTKSYLCSFSFYYPPFPFTTLSINSLASSLT